MVNISVADALEIAEKHFPFAPEKLVEDLNIEVLSRPLNCDGWCLQYGDKSLIRINSNSAKARQRFTLAHELGHLILGIPSVIGERISDFQTSPTAEERRVNALAASILLPEKILLNYISEIPVTSTVIGRIAKAARVSEVFVARRLASSAKTLGMKGGLIIFYRQGLYEWQWSDSHKLKPSATAELLAECLKATPNLARIPRVEENDVLVASILENPSQVTKTIFLQIVDTDIGLKELHEESRSNLERLLFDEAEQYQQSLQGCLSAMKVKARDLNLDEALELFNNRYIEDQNRWSEEFRNRLKSKPGQAYISLRLKSWVRN